VLPDLVAVLKWETLVRGEIRRGGHVGGADLNPCCHLVEKKSQKLKVVAAG